MEKKPRGGGAVIQNHRLRVRTEGLYEPDKWSNKNLEKIEKELARVLGKN